MSSGDDDDDEDVSAGRRNYNRKEDEGCGADSEHHHHRRSSGRYTDREEWNDAGRGDDQFRSPRTRDGDGVKVLICRVAI